jgi:TrmH family RNA methyltransferase
MDPLSSLQNPRIKQLVALRESRQRRRTGLTRVDGGRELLRALEAGLVPDTVFVREDLEPTGDLGSALELCAARGHLLQPVTVPVYEKIRYGDRDEGICATLAWQPLDLSDLPQPGPDFVLALEAAEKPGNLGALLRSADAAGVGAVLLCDPGCDPTNPNVVRASMGTLFTQPVVRCTSEEAIEYLRSSGSAIVVSRPQAARSWFEADLAGPVAIVSGAESRGLSQKWVDAADVQVALPMRGFADSLNLAAATAVLLYEVVRQRA